MANAAYPTALASFLSADIDIPADDIRIVLLDLDGATPYAYNAAHQYLSDVAVGARRATSAPLANKTVTAGTFDFDNPTITSVAGPEDVEGYIVYQHTGVDNTSRLIAYVDREPDGVTPIALTPDGGNVLVTIPAGGQLTI